MKANVFKPIFKTVKCSVLTPEQQKKCSELYSENYGYYSGIDNVSKQGQHIKLSPSSYRKLGENPHMFVSLCYVGEKLLGQAFFLRKELEDGKKCSWVTQLLVHHSYRNRKIATRLLQSAWGFSDYYAWGLATTNAVTIKTLESVTWRRVDPNVICDHLEEIGSLCDEIAFTDKDQIRLGAGKSQIFTNFYPEFQRLENNLTDIYVKKLGSIEDGCEWLAFTFQHQDMFFDEKHWEQMLDFSEYQLEDAYSRMAMSSQGWTRFTAYEVDFIERHGGINRDSKILDVGCGQGRHSLELANRGYKNVVAYDFSERLINKAKDGIADHEVKFEVKDCRHLKRDSFDLAICLYDVIGSFRSYADNLSIVKSLYRSLKRGGRCVVSVMNMELTEHIATHKVADVKNNPQALLKLKASHIMQSSGNVFEPDFFLLDTSSHLVYRKEQFEMDGELSSEYVIADYRFTRRQICDVFEEVGFTVVSATFVRAGAWDTPLSPTDSHAKEILLVAKKG